MSAFSPTDLEVQQLGEQGYFLRPSFLGPEAARAAAEEVQALVEQGALTPAGLSRGAGWRLDAAERGDLTTWWVPGLGGPALATLASAFAALGEEVSRAAFLGLGRHDTQLAFYPGGGARYVRHLDAFPGRADNRRLTAILYLNPHWQPAHGGQLRLYPEGGMVEVEPRLDTLVVFLAERLEHEVLPAHAPRLAATSWYYGRTV